LAFLFKEINSIKRQLKPQNIANSKKRKAESLLSTAAEINLTTISDEDEDYFAFSSSFSGTKG
jgi:hypothetical protein